MSAKNPVVSIIGGTVWGNRGAESMLVTVIGRLSESNPATRFNVFSYYPAKDRDLVEDEAITILSGKPLSLITRHLLGALIVAALKKMGFKPPKGEFFKIARALSNSDLLLDIGGITFSDGRERYLPFNILTIWPAMLLHVPVIKMAQAVGPFNHPLNRLCARIFLLRCGHVFARGEKTADYLKELNFPADCFDTVADTAFLYQPCYALSDENTAKVDALVQSLRERRKEGFRTIVISPSILVDEESSRKRLNYAEMIFKGIESLSADGLQFVLLPNATRESTDKKHNNDLLTISRLKSLAEAGRLSAAALRSVEWITYDINSASIRRIIDESDVLITSRYHAMIAGLSLAVPTAVIGWGHKYRETMAYFGLDDYSLDFGTRETDLAVIIRQLLENNALIKAQIRRHLPDIKDLAQIQFTYLQKALS